MSIQGSLVLTERLELSLPKELVPKTSASAIPPNEHVPSPTGGEYCARRGSRTLTSVTSLPPQGSVYTISPLTHLCRRMDLNHRNLEYEASALPLCYLDLFRLRLQRMKTMTMMIRTNIVPTEGIGPPRTGCRPVALPLCKAGVFPNGLEPSISCSEDKRSIH